MDNNNGYTPLKERAENLLQSLRKGKTPMKEQDQYSSVKGCFQNNNDDELMQINPMNETYDE